MRTLTLLLSLAITAAAFSSGSARSLAETTLVGAPAPTAETSAIGESSIVSLLITDSLSPSFDEAPAASGDAAAMGTPSPAINVTGDLLASGAFRLDVPFRTQKDGDRFQGSNCGPASLAMVFAGYGIDQSNSELRLRSHTYQGTAGGRGGTALQFMAMAAADFDIAPLGLYDGQSFHRWTIDEIRGQLGQGRPVVPLVKYRLLPDHETSTTRFDHYVVIYGTDGDRFLYHDPAFAAAADGAARWMSSSQLKTAMAAAIVPNQAVAFAAGSRSALGAREMAIA